MFLLPPQMIIDGEGNLTPRWRASTGPYAGNFAYMEASLMVIRFQNTLSKKLDSVRRPILQASFFWGG